MFSSNMRNQLFAVQLTFDLGVLIPRVSPKRETKGSGGGGAFIVAISRFEPVILYQPFKRIFVNFIAL